MVAVAGHLSTSADPLHPVYTLRRHASEPSASAMPNGHFPSGKLTFRLATPAQVGVGVIANEFKQPEPHAYNAMSAARNGHFARGHGGFNQYCHMQQKAKMLVPSLPMHSRVDELHRVSTYAKRFEAQRTATLESLHHNDQRRMARLRQAKTLLHTRSLSKDVNKKLQASCTLHDIEPEPCGELSPTMQLLNRRVDINRLKRCRTQLAQQQKHEDAKQAVVKVPELKEVVADIKRFESEHLPDLLIETLVDWKGASAISWAPGSPGTPDSLGFQPFRSSDL